MKVSDLLAKLGETLGREATHRDLAEIFGVTRAAVSQWLMNGDRVPIRRQLELRLTRADLLPPDSSASSAGASSAADASAFCAE